MTSENKNTDKPQDMGGVIIPHRDQAEREALVELLTSLPPLPESWPAGTVQSALIRALNTYEHVLRRAGAAFIKVIG